MKKETHLPVDDSSWNREFAEGDLLKNFVSPRYKKVLAKLALSNEVNVS